MKIIVPPAKLRLFLRGASSIFDMAGTQRTYLERLRRRRRPATDQDALWRDFLAVNRDLHSAALRSQKDRHLADTPKP